jgi:hypothetical protein
MIDDLQLLIIDLMTTPFLPLPNQPFKINNHQSAISAGKRLSLQPSPIYHVKRSPELHQALDRFMEE